MIRRILILAAACYVSAYAVDPHRAMSQYVRDRWGPEQGFPLGAVYAITQTPDGYLWIASEAGLIRFDGLSFRQIRDETGGQSFTSVLGLVPDRDGSLWLRLADTTMIRYRNGVFDDPIRKKPHDAEVTAATGSSQGGVLAALLQQGAFTYRDSELRLVAKAEGMPRSPVISIAQESTGDVWLGTRSAGLFRLSGGKTIPTSRGLPDTKVNCILVNAPNDLWAGTDRGIAHWDGARMSAAGTPAWLGKLQVLALVKDRDGNLWIGTDSNGLLRFNPQGLSALDPTPGDSAAITALFEDREANIWIGSTHGLERLRDSAFVTYSAPEGLPTEGDNPVYVDEEQRVWFAPATGGLWWARGDTHGRRSEAGLDKDIVYSIAGDKDELWLGRQRGGLTRLGLKGGSSTYTHAQGLGQNSVYSVYRSRDGAVWAGTLSGGVSRLENGKLHTYKITDGLAANTVASILEDDEGAMWFATPGGLSRLSHGEWKTFTSKDGLPSNNVICLLVDTARNLWAGTAAGLSVLRNGHFVGPSSLPAELREQILGMAEDKFGFLWIATANHVLRVNRTRYLDGTLSEADLRFYGLSDGLRGMEGVKRHQSVAADSLGRIWFSLNRGISVVDPARLTLSGAPVLARVQSIVADGEEIVLKPQIHIPSGKQRVVLSFAALSLSVPERIRYRYRLQGFDHGWSELTEGRQAVYTNLGPGPYTFQLIASNPDGVLSPEETALGFAVDPALWQTWWFRVAVVTGGLVGFAGLYRMRMNTLTATLTMRFEERLAERTRIAQELHDTLLQGFLSASMHVNVAADQLPDESRTKPILVNALKLMRQVIEEGRNVVRGLRATDAEPLDLEQAFSKIPSELTSGEQLDAGVLFRVIVEGRRRTLHPVIRDEVYRIGREALINAFRHSHAKNIEIELKYSSRRLKLLVRDDGCGIDSHTLVSGREGHWGLSGMRERAERIRARLQIWSGVAGSAASAGTEVELSVPGSVAFQNPGSMALRFRK